MELTTVGLPSASARRVMIAGNAPMTPTAAAPFRKRRRGTESRESNGGCGSLIFPSLGSINTATFGRVKVALDAPRLLENPASAGRVCEMILSSQSARLVG